MIHLPLQHTISYFARKHFLYRSNGWVFSDYRLSMFVGESPSWKKWYLPVDVQGLTILDVGAGEGESARFYLEHGAKKVICIECDDVAFKNLALNAVGKPMECYHKRFDLSDLKREHDFLKLDIEGGEAALLDLKSHVSVPCVIELHSIELAKAFYKKGYTLKNVMGCSTNIQFRLGNLKMFDKVKMWLCYAY